MSADPLLVLDGVFAGYGKMTILNGTTARIRRAAITTVIGPNGAGKSTMFKTIFGLLSVRSGTITLDGRAITNFSPRQVLDAGRRLHSAGPQYFSRAERAPQSRARRCRLVRSGEPSGALGKDHAALSDVEREGATRRRRRCPAGSRRCSRSRAGCCLIRN